MFIIICVLGQVTTLAGTTSTSGSNDGVGTNAKFYFPSGVTVSSDGSLLYVADALNFEIRTIALSSGNTMFIYSITVL
jgi:sugar lactone lactonase YvrE